MPIWVLAPSTVKSRSPSKLKASEIARECSMDRPSHALLSPAGLVFGRSFFPLFAIAMIVGAALWGPWVSLGVHAGCVPKSPVKPVSHSTVFMSNFFNLTMFNIGFHLEHHEYPRVHWSELPKLHGRLKPVLVDGGAHVVPYGNYHAAFLLAGDDDRQRRFHEQDPRYNQ
jgi:fatty acid desaturase